jgi:hypothetical protein
VTAARLIAAQFLGLRCKLPRVRTPTHEKRNRMRKAATALARTRRDGLVPVANAFPMYAALDNRSRRNFMTTAWP